uniref:Uncharacterized protein n=1 Tax=Romanomermis culicivorax TaxID=13658 RepID=A0A915L6A0_ROMCU
MPQQLYSACNLFKNSTDPWSSFINLYVYLSNVRFKLMLLPRILYNSTPMYIIPANSINNLHKIVKDMCTRDCRQYHKYICTNKQTN